MSYDWQTNFLKLFIQRFNKFNSPIKIYNCEILISFKSRKDLFLNLSRILEKDGDLAVTVVAELGDEKSQVA